MSDIDKRVLAIKELLQAFKLERILYVVISCIAVSILLTVAIFIMVKNPEKIEWFISLFVPAGAITYSIGRILKMWNQALTFVSNQKIGGNDEA
ncbi:conserved hypothetical protein [Tenacibaculum sediminilitoris]|uniref:hypothetical protein n=1 Tax=Tenacibaculum sediminilitoris TaxID=1820334 RepID=UPI00389463D5